jgi:hypothetical protein
MLNHVRGSVLGLFHPRGRSALLAAWVLVSASACGGRDDCEGASCPAPEGSVGLTEPFDTLTVTTMSGNSPTPEAGSTCDLNDYAELFTFDRLSQQVSWDICSSNAAVDSRTGQRQLGDAELAAVLGAYARVKLSAASTCGADDGLVLLDVETASGVELYADDYYSGCPWGPLEGRTFVTGLPELSNTLRQLPY